MRLLPIDVLGYKPPIASIDRMRILVSAFLSIRAAVQSIGGYFLSMAFQERFNNGPTAETNPIYIYILIYSILMYMMYVASYFACTTNLHVSSHFNTMCVYDMSYII
jgi:hypothetical protein